MTRTQIQKILWIYAVAFVLVALGFRVQAAETKKGKKKDKAAVSETKAAGKTTYAKFETNLGNFKVKLFTDKTPKTADNFIGLAEGTKEWTDPKTGKKVKRPFYNGLIFHRIIDGFMIQGGDPLGNGSGGPGYEFDNEIDPSLTHGKPGVMSMANAGPNTNGSQFFITLSSDHARLDGKYSIFGEVVEGMDVVSKIGKVKTQPGDRPVEDVIMKKVTIVRE